MVTFSILAAYGFSEKESKTLNASVFTVVWLLYCAQLCTVRVERKLLVYFVLYYSRKGSSEEGLILKSILLHMVIRFDIIGLLDFTQ